MNDGKTLGVYLFPFSQWHSQVMVGELDYLMVLCEPAVSTSLVIDCFAIPFVTTLTALNIGLLIMCPHSIEPARLMSFSKSASSQSFVLTTFLLLSKR